MLAALALALLMAAGLGFAAYAVTAPDFGLQAMRVDTGRGARPIPSAEFIFFSIFSMTYLLWATLPLSIGSSRQFDPGHLLLYPISFRKLFALDFISEVASLQSVFAIPAILAVGVGVGLARGRLADCTSGFHSRGNIRRRAVKMCVYIHRLLAAQEADARRNHAGIDWHGCGSRRSIVSSGRSALVQTYRINHGLALDSARSYRLRIYGGHEAGTCLAIYLCGGPVECLHVDTGRIHILDFSPSHSWWRKKKAQAPDNCCRC